MTTLANLLAEVGAIAVQLRIKSSEFASSILQNLQSHLFPKLAVPYEKVHKGT